MRFRIEQHFEAPVDAVERVYTDPAFLERLAALPKLGRPTLLDRRTDGATIRQSVRYRFVGDLSSAVRRVVDPARLTWVEESTHDTTTHRTEWRIVPDHYGSLLRCRGTFVLVAEGPAATRRVAEGDMRVSVPLVGGRVEAAIVSGLEEHAVLEAEAAADWLDQHGTSGG
ncbi:MAG TPA: DUF2505 domain-containing protein [Acidimicrobiales bacterium]|nr:DUF2505 domain-containing protein [Acidimicrobiales bacterium]